MHFTTIFLRCIGAVTSALNKLLCLLIGNHLSLCVRCVQLFATPRTVAHQAFLPMGFSRQEYWSELPSPPPGHLPDPGIETAFLASPALQTDFYCLSPGRIHLLGQSV